MAFLFFFFCNVFFYMWLRWVWQGHWWAFISEDMGVHACAKPGRENKEFFPFVAAFVQWWVRWHSLLSVPYSREGGVFAPKLSCSHVGLPGAS